MSYPPFCLLCGSKANWNSDFNCEDYGFDCDGIVGVYTCSCCQTTFYIIDIFLNDSQPRIVKYEYRDEECDCIDIPEEISNCLICSNTLNLLSTKNVEVNDILIHDSPIEQCVLSMYKCNHCQTTYNVVDRSSESHLSNDDFPIFYNRSIHLDDLM